MRDAFPTGLVSEQTPSCRVAGSYSMHPCNPIQRVARSPMSLNVWFCVQTCITRISLCRSPQQLVVMMLDG